jgi:5'(3')-deoxyribonucleotidase
MIDEGKLGKISSTNDFFFKNISNARRCFLKAKPFPGVKEAIDSIREKGFRVAICTHQPHRHGRDFTLKFLDINDIHYDELHFSHEKWRIAADYIIDDSPEFLNELKETATKFCIDYPFNRHLTFASGRRVESVKKALEFIELEEIEKNETLSNVLNLLVHN